MTLRDALLRLRALLLPRRTERELHEELQFHLARETAKYIEQGMSPPDARARAQARFGSTTVVADACRDERGIGAFETLVRDLLYACRSFRRVPLVALTIVATVGLGLGLVTVVFTFLNVFLFRVDEVQDPHELFAVERPRTASGDRVPFTLPHYDALRRDTAVFSGVFARLGGVDSRVSGRTMSAALVTGNFFHVLGVSAALGRTLLPADDADGAGQPVAVLSHRGWELHFASDPHVLGRTLLVNGVTFQIVGVMPDGFRGLMVGPPDYWAPLSTLGLIQRLHAGREDTVGVEIIGRLKPGVSRDQAQAQLIVWDSRNGARSQSADRAATVVLEPRQGTLPHPAEAMMLFTPLFFAFGLILLIGCANIANLLLARGVARQKEIGIRLALGASRRRIASQLLTESLLPALAAAALGFAVSRLVLEVTIHAVMSTMPPDAGDVRLAVPAADWRVGLFLVAGALVSTVLFALAPALQTTRLDLVRAVRGEILRDARPGRARSALIAMQVTASVLLLICAAVFLRSAWSASIVDPGIRTADTILIEIVNEETRAAMLDAVRREPAIAEVAASWPEALGRPRAAFAEGASGRSVVFYRLVSPELFAVLGVEIVRGRGFTPAERSTAHGVVVVSESVARALWPQRDAVGQVLVLEADPDSDTRRADEPRLLARTFEVVGVARDVAGFRLADYEEAGVYMPIDAATPETSLFVRVHGDPEVARRALVDRLTAVDPSMGSVVTLRTIAGLAGYFLRIAFWLTLMLGALALLLTLSGLFSVLSYLVEQRTKEIGVRMALGASAPRVARLVLRQSAPPVGAGIAAGASLAAGVTLLLMLTPAAEPIGALVRVFDPWAYLAATLCVVVACSLAAFVPSVRAARVDPMTTLRHE